MDLAIALGQPGHHALARRMTEAEFVEWQHYASKRMLPQRRMELYLAQIAYHIDRLNGARNRTLQDYLFDPVDDREPTAEDEIEFFGFAPRRRTDG